ncbi:DUF4440 domain-containing protein [Erythrobacter sp. THAF29]|uniref:DUF4440 domain-containing protein n=1 Tax=Erythrobacter sp. THAF29 TaxID=2587851 RepID=UPI001267C0BD|nr:DUF4440 domain-containing protein [Erythrobacter sp. THAF29]QFT76650.1 hypothetical protein FIU90_03735 [Erythrobacter sp. THAF29]
MFATTLIAMAQAAAPIPPIEEARAQIEARDAALFWAAFEGCDANALESLLTEDYRMLHDLAGLAVPNRAAFVENMQQQCKSREASGYRNRRLLVPGSRSVTPLGDWGVLERGWHTFSEWRGEEVGWVQTGGAQYWHVWRWEGEEGAFRLAESISVDHGAAPAYPPPSE